MLTVVGMSDPDLEDLCQQVRKSMPGKVCQLANHLFPQGRVCSGHLSALGELKKMATAKGALKVQEVAVSGAFHTSLMDPAKAALEEVLKTVTIHDPRIPVYSNVTAEPLTSKDEIAAMLAKQLVSPVLWEPTINNLIKAGKTQCFELGPGQQIKAMTKRIDMNVWKSFKNIQP